VKRPEWKERFLADYTPDEKERVALGKLCPNDACRGKDIKFVGCNPDGRVMNHAYDCCTCGAQWEGY
jgi:hypothetical protein